MPNQTIKCNVATCKHYDRANVCTLNSIVVGNTNCDAKCSRETECDSFVNA